MVDNLTRRDVLHALATSSAATLAGCSELVDGTGGHPWPQYGGDPGHTARADSLDGEAELAWTYPLEYGAETQPVLTRDGPVVSDPWFTYAVDEAGEERWRFDSDEPFDNPKLGGVHAVVDDWVVVPYDRGLHVRSLADGSEGWTTDLNTGLPLVHDGALYTVTGDALYRLDAKSGRVEHERTNVELDFRSLTWGPDSLVAARTYVDDDAGAGTALRGVVAGLDPDDLSTTWAVEYDGVSRFGVPSMADGVAYVPAHHQPNDESTLVAVDTETGSELWTAPVDWLPCESVAVGDDAVFVGTWDGDVFAFDAGTGEERWRATVESSATATVHASPLADEDTVVVPVQDEGLVAFATEMGEERWSLDLGVGRHAPVADGDRVYVAGDDLYAVDLS